MYGKTTEKLAFEKKLASIPGGIIFGWLGDKIGRRKVFMMMILTLSFATDVTVRAARRARDRMTQVGRLPRPISACVQQYVSIEIEIFQRCVNSTVPEFSMHCAAQSRCPQAVNSTATEISNALERSSQ